MTRLRVGVVGCGAIAQIQHLPHLRDGRDRFEIGGICDIAPDLLRKVGDDFHVPAAGTFHRRQRPRGLRHRRRADLFLRIPLAAGPGRGGGRQTRAGRKTGLYHPARGPGYD